MFYMNEILVKQIEELLKEEDKLSALCNVTAAIYQSMDNINWAGFYFYKNGKFLFTKRQDTQLSEKKSSSLLSIS